MKITRTDKDERAYQRNKKIANKNCDVCPCCGHPVDVDGATSVSERTWYGKANEGATTLFDLFFRSSHLHHYKVDCYHCYNCGAMWESDPYIYEY